MATRAVLATQSQLGRSKGDSAITRPSLMKALAAKGVRMTAQRRLLVSIIQDTPRHLDAARFCSWRRNRTRRLTAPPCIGPLLCSRIAD